MSGRGPARRASSELAAARFVVLDGGRLCRFALSSRGRLVMTSAEEAAGHLPGRTQNIHARSGPQDPPVPSDERICARVHSGRTRLGTRYRFLGGEEPGVSDERKPKPGIKVEPLELNPDTLADLTDGEASAVQGGTTKPPNRREQEAVEGDDQIFWASH